ncbi:MAG TPA: ABC transporter substrate-binding protein [Ktedonobacteraceae bacterium]|nr:ABC transporter substrate-binding protein [Ktedonobacteraceae bacterium]
MHSQPYTGQEELSAARRQRPAFRVFRAAAASCLLFLVLGLLLAACGGSSANNSGSNSSNDKITLTMLDYLGTEPANSEINKLIKNYESLHPNVTIKRDSVPIGSLITKASQETASHTLPSLMIIDNPDLPTFASTGALTQLDQYMTGDLSAANFYAGSLSTMQYQGKTYAISTGNNDLALFYNKKMFADAGLQPPTTWADLEADAAKLTKGNTYGFAMSAPATEEGSWQFEPFLWSNGADLDKVDSAQGTQALQFLANLVQKGYMSKAALNWGQGDVLTQFEEGHAAMMENGPWNLSLLKKAGTDYGVVPLPVPASSAKPVSPLGGEIWTIPQTDQQHEQAAWDFLKWLLEPAQVVDYDTVQGYMPPLKAVSQQVLQSNPDLQVFTDELNTARARTAVVGAKYPSISQAIWTAEQAALSGSQTPQAALTQAQQSIDKILKG